MPLIQIEAISANHMKVSSRCNKLNGRFLVTGLARNCAKQIKGDVARLKSAIGKTKELYWLIIESDSEDSTVSALANLTKEIENFSYISLGELRSKLPLRTERLAYCRNTYLDQIRHNKTYDHIDYVVVSDFDGLNTHISTPAIESCWERYDWDMCAANQKGPYYDIWALRHKKWCPGDCWSQYNFLKKFTPIDQNIIYSCVHSLMIELPVNNDWIEVDSAFGGLAIYKKKLFNMGKYIGISKEGNEICEHVHFHNNLRQHNARLFINPKLINAEYTEHTEMSRLSQLKQLEEENKMLHTRLKHLEETIRNQNIAIYEHERTLNKMFNSSSWRMTKPVRKLSTSFRKRSRAIRAFFKQ